MLLLIHSIFISMCMISANIFVNRE